MTDKVVAGGLIIHDVNAAHSLVILMNSVRLDNRLIWIGLHTTTDYVGGFV